MSGRSVTHHRMPRWLATLLGLPLLVACASRPAPLDALAVAAAGESTLMVIGTRAAEQETLTATALWPTATPTPTKTATATATSTTTATTTPSPTPLPSGTVSGTVTLRAGPGLVYGAEASLQGGETARPLGQTTAGDWLLITLESGEEGWLPAARFVLAEGAGELAIITDLPPTPTLPPFTLTPTVPPPTATNTPSPYTCDLSVQWDPDGRHVILIGQGWPPSTPVTLQITSTFAGVTRTFTSANLFGTGDADDQIPNGFWHRMDGGTATYTASTWACSKTVTGP